MYLEARDTSKYLGFQRICKCFVALKSCDVHATCREGLCFVKGTVLWARTVLQHLYW